MPSNIEIFEPGYTYHIFNRAVGNDVLFPKVKNYSYFLYQIEKHLSKHLDFYAYCLMKNHYHFQAKVNESTSPKKVSEAFRRFGIAYSQAINKQEGRKGGLFMRPVKRKRVTTEKYFKTLLVYIHRNPVHHGVCKSFEDYPWSSYSEYLGLEVKGDDTAQSDVIPTKPESNTPNLIKNPKELLKKYFEDEENFKYVHQINKSFNSIEDLIIE